MIIKKSSLENQEIILANEIKTYSDDILLSEVEPIEKPMLNPETSGWPIETLVEYPLLEAAKIFINKGIKTQASSANKKDVVGSREVYLALYFDSLNENNKKIVEEKKYKIYEEQSFKKIKIVKIVWPITSKTTVGEVRQEFKRIANLFENQFLN